MTFEPHPDWALGANGAPPLLRHEIEQVLSEIKYKPSYPYEWRFTAFDHCPEAGCIVHIEVALPDSHDPEILRPFLYEIHGPVFSAAQLVDAVGQGIADIETHEWKEGFLYQGRHVVDPHPPGNANFVVRGN